MTKLQGTSVKKLLFIVSWKEKPYIGPYLTKFR